MKHENVAHLAGYRLIENSQNAASRYHQTYLNRSARVQSVKGDIGVVWLFEDSSLLRNLVFYILKLRFLRHNLIFFISSV